MFLNPASFNASKVLEALAPIKQYTITFCSGSQGANPRPPFLNQILKLGNAVLSGNLHMKEKARQDRLAV